MKRRLLRGDRIIILEDYQDGDILIHRGTIGIVVRDHGDVCTVTWGKSLDDESHGYATLGVGILKEVKMQPGDKIIVTRDFDRLRKGEVGVITEIIDNKYERNIIGLDLAKYYEVEFKDKTACIPFEGLGDYYEKIKNNQLSPVRNKILQRKVFMGKKFYAVKEGKRKGVFESWEECKKQVEGFSGAIYKSFPTKERALEYLSISQDKNNEEETAEETPYAFVDGSFNADTGVYGFGGFLVVDGSKYILLGNGRDSELAEMRNVAGEILGTIKAVKLAESLKIPELRIVYDYKGIEEWAKGRWSASKKGTREYVDFMNSPERTVNVEFKKVKGHDGVWGNEVADVIAKFSAGVKLTNKQKELLSVLVTEGSAQA